MKKFFALSPLLAYLCFSVCLTSLGLVAAQTTTQDPITSARQACAQAASVQGYQVSGDIFRLGATPIATGYQIAMLVQRSNTPTIGMCQYHTGTRQAQFQVASPTSASTPAATAANPTQTSPVQASPVTPPTASQPTLYNTNTTAAYTTTTATSVNNSPTLYTTTTQTSTPQTASSPAMEKARNMCSLAALAQGYLISDTTKLSVVPNGQNYQVTLPIYLNRQDIHTTCSYNPATNQATLSQNASATLATATTTTATPTTTPLTAGAQTTVPAATSTTSALEKQVLERCARAAAQRGFQVGTDFSGFALTQNSSGYEVRMTLNSYGRDYSTLCTFDTRTSQAKVTTLGFAEQTPATTATVTTIPTATTTATSVPAIPTASTSVPVVPTAITTTTTSATPSLAANTTATSSTNMATANSNIALNAQNACARYASTNSIILVSAGSPLLLLDNSAIAGASVPLKVAMADYSTRNAQCLYSQARGVINIYVY